MQNTFIVMPSHFLIHAAQTKKGGMNKEEFGMWMKQNFVPLVAGDVSDRPGKRVVLLVDGGLGRTNKQMLRIELRQSWESISIHLDLLTPLIYCRYWICYLVTSKLFITSIWRCFGSIDRTTPTQIQRPLIEMMLGY